MKTIKLIIVSLCLSLVVNGLLANTKPNLIKNETEQIKSYLKKAEFNRVITSNRDVNIQFTINNMNEIVVNCTSDADLDALIKSSLNYKSIQLSTLERNTTYTMPVHILLRN
jgi:hypothetical protein